MLDKVDKFIDSNFKEHVNPGSGEIIISKEDGNIYALNDTILSPGETAKFYFEHEFLRRYGKTKWELSTRSALAQAGLNVKTTVIERNLQEVLVENLHPRNRYLIPKGHTRLGRLYLTSDLSLISKDLENVITQMRSLTNQFDKKGGLSKVDNGIRLPLLSDYALQAGYYSTDKPVNIQELSPGAQRWKVNQELGNKQIGGGPDSYDPKELTDALVNSHFRLLSTCLFTTPEGIALVIQNPDSLPSKVIDGGFTHMVVGEFSDSFLKKGDSRTTDSLLIKAYKARVV